MNVEFDDGDGWVTEALERGWSEGRVGAIEESLKMLDAHVTIVHSAVILIENGRGGRFAAIRDAGTKSGLEHANAALLGAGYFRTSSDAVVTEEEIASRDNTSAWASQLTS